MGRLGALVLLAVCELVPVVAAPHRLHIHANPAITILSIAQDRDGWLWLAAQEGLFRFDGFHYQKIRDYPFPSARFLTFTSDGSLWIGSTQGLVRYKDRFTVILRDEIMAMAGYPDKIFVKIGNFFESIGLDGSIVRHRPRLRADLTIGPSGLMWFVPVGQPRAAAVDPRHPDIFVEEIPLLEPMQQAVRDSQGRLWTSDGARAVAYQNGRPVEVLTRRDSQETLRASPLLPGSRGQLWFLGEVVQGVAPPIRFQGRRLNSQFQPTAGYQDGRDHLWVARLRQGLAEWIPDPSWHRWFSEEFDENPTSQVVRTREGTVIAGTHKNLYRLDRAHDRWVPFPAEPRNYSALLPLPGGSLLASIRKFGVARLSPTGQVIERPANPLRSFDEYRAILKDGAGRIWVGNKLGLLRLEGKPGSLRLRREYLPGDQNEFDDHAVDLETDSAGRPWVGYWHGIVWLDEHGVWHKIPTDRPVNRIRSFTLADRQNAEDIWVAYRRSGSFGRLQKSGKVWKVTEFASSAGYRPEDTHFIKRDSRGWIWRGAPDGVHISDGVHVEPNDWIHLSLATGLATDSTDQYGFFEDRDGTVWISGEDGVSHLEPDPSWFDAPHAASPPRITRLEVDGIEQKLSGETPPPLPVPKEVLRVEVGSLDAPLFRDFPLRYRLLPLTRQWRLSSDGTLDFHHLAICDCTLEVAFTGNGSSPKLTVPLRVGSAPFNWSSGLWLLSLPLGVGVLARFLPWPQRIRYHMAKDLFLLRRRFVERKAEPRYVPPANPYGRSGELVAERYRLVRVVSRGGFSVVYDARDLQQDGARVAVKCLSGASVDPGWLRDRFAHEVAALQSVRHPAVVRVLDSWISPEGEPCLAMPFLEGPTLREALGQGPFAPARAAFTIRQLGGALAEIHRRGIVHRDLKPENVVLHAFEGEPRQPVLIDFGAAALRGKPGELNSTTLLAGSFHYMAPERLSGHYAPSSDTYSLGVMALEIVTGKRLGDLQALYADDAFPQELQQVIASCVSQEAAPHLANQLCRAYAPNPQDRPPDAGRWAEEVAAILDQCV